VDTFDADNQMVKDTDPDGNVTLTQFDAVGNDVADTDANGKTTITSLMPTIALT